MAEPIPLPGGGAVLLEGGRATILPQAPPPRRTERPRAEPLPLPPAPRRRAGFAALHLMLGRARLAVPAALAWRIHPFTAPTPLPAAPPGLLGLAVLGGAPLPVLAWPGAPGAPEAAHLVELRNAGRRFALPAARVSAGPEGGGPFLAWLEREAAPLLALAPAAQPAAPAPAIPTRALVAFIAGGVEAALPAEAVLAALPPQSPAPVPGGAVAAHRGEVLPVRDAGPLLGGPPTPLPAPLLRLAGPPGLLVLVSAVAGVRHLPAADLHALAPGGLLAALALQGAAALPVLSAAALAQGGRA
ncbi:hypothetical protein ACI6QG_04375 [Roseococcus sp. DSY-14]|uniref:hypothetical protein n=1 Tax=Roseococcus sp. DSY-14 TaxID=3369650 RepID=UPI00387A9068